ncbi:MULTISPECIES: porin family protein [Sphingobacterium]|uniref:porin family protein n=1 Tax=Sphingobacterium TaxID=28453 RepID=UPI002580ACFE|nr:MULTISPECIES: porin family protein [Sphingobacterium]
MKRKLLSIAAALCFIAGAKAQTSYGIKAGANFAKMKESAQGFSYTSDAATSFYVAGYADIPLANSFSIQPGISLQGKGSKISLTKMAELAGISGVSGSVKQDLMYIEIPVNFVYSIPTGNSGNVFFGAGPYAGFGIHAKVKADNISGSFEDDFFDVDGKESGSFGDFGYKTFDAGLNVLAGFKFTNGFLINGGYGLGLTNIAKDTNGEGSLKNRVFSVGVGYQF